MRIINVIAMLALSCAGCVSQVHHTGYELNHADLRGLKIGSSTKESVVALLGSPSHVVGADENEWYYMSLSIKSNPFSKMQIKKIDLLKLTFKGDKLSGLDLKQGDKSTSIQTSKDVASEVERDPAVLQDMWKNLGRFSKLKKGY